ncbi:MAG: asparagine synthase C-terminal domain-containing protein [Thermoplasmata archaeon]
MAASASGGNSERDGRYFASLDHALSSVLAPWLVAPGRVVVLFSGGVDSGLLAWELRHHPRLVLFTIGTQGSSGLAVAKEAANQLGLPGEVSEIDTRAVQGVVDQIRPELSDLGPTLRSVQTSVAVALARAPEGQILCGQGIDELFLGYAHFRGLDSGEAGRRADADLVQLLDREWPRTLRIAKRLGRTVAAPYLDPGFVAAARSIPLEYRQPSPNPKAVFRRWAVHRGLPPTIANRPKQALQFGSGIDRILAREQRRGWASERD